MRPGNNRNSSPKRFVPGFDRSANRGSITPVEGAPMRRIAYLLVAVAALGSVVAYMAPASGQADREAAPIFGIKIPPGYRDWRLISVAHEEGNLNDLRAVLGND